MSEESIYLFGVLADPEAESLLVLLRWWESMGLDEKSTRAQLESGFQREALEAAARLLVDLRTEDGSGEQPPLEEQPLGEGKAAASEDLLNLFRQAMRDADCRSRVEAMRVDAATLVRVSSEVMNLHEVLREAPRRRGGGFLPSRANEGAKARGLVCSYCKKSFRGRKNLSSHIRKYHETQSGFMCSFCGEVFGTRKYLADHEAKIHAEEAREAGLELNAAQQHAQSSSSSATAGAAEHAAAAAAVPDAVIECSPPDPRHVCQECGRAFSRRCRLREHIDCVHEQIRRKFVCTHGEGCNAAFGSNWLLRQHVAVVHWGQRKYACPICGKRFGYVHHVRSHLKHRHKERAQEAKDKGGEGDTEPSA